MNRKKYVDKFMGICTQIFKLVGLRTLQAVGSSHCEAAVSVSLTHKPRTFFES